MSRFFEEFFIIQAGIAVILFYVISGFYMSVVITTKYQPSGPGWEWRFLSQRFLRLLPPYWATLVFTLLVYAMIGKTSVFTSDLGLTALQRLLTVFTNISVIGMDFLVAADTTINMAMGVKNFSFLWEKYPVFLGWTVGVELTFYFFAAFFALRNDRNAIVALLIGVYIRCYFLVLNGKFLDYSVTGIGYSNTPWGYHFFGTNLVYFMLGWVAFKFYQFLQEKCDREPEFRVTVIAMTAGFLAVFLSVCYIHSGYVTIADYNDYRAWLAVVTFVPIVGPLFLLTKDSKIDNYIGLFSYPIYLCHVIAVIFGATIFGVSQGDKYFNLAFVFVMSVALVYLVELPVERLRRRVAAKARQAAKPPAAPVSVQ